MEMQIVIGGMLVILGAVLGSFAGAQVWRLRARQLEEDKNAGESYDKKEYARLKILIGRKQKDDRSLCLHCKHTLAWYDLIPIVSWLATKGKCRYCKRSIGYFEPTMEIVMALFSIVSYILWPWDISGTWPLFIVWMVAGVTLLIMAAYDAKWQLLPDIANYAFIGLSVAFILLRVYFVGDVSTLSLVGSLAMLAGLYLALFMISRGAWIGFGDVKLCIGLALFLADWKLAFLALFLANLLGCFMVIPGLLSKKLTASSQVAFGPLLMAGMVISFLLGSYILELLMGFSIV
ncbi:MAG: prepilin peptidase [Candidatus Saccharimonas sp.]